MSYLDVNKSVIISSPAGSGKTEKLARRYIALLKSGAEVERILAVTFTDKAAAEMRQRIFRILKEEDEVLFRKLLQKMSLMMVSTIHSFCGTLLRRFSFEAAIDPNYRIDDAIDSRIVWEGILYEILMDAGEGREGHELLLQALCERGFRGLEHLKNIINDLFEKRPFSLEAENPDLLSDANLFPIIEELKKWPGSGEAIEGYRDLFKEDAFNRLVLAEKYFLTNSKMPRKKIPAHLKGIVDYQGWALKMWQYWKNRILKEHMSRGKRVKEIFNKCFDKYREKKTLKGVLDFSDLEYLAFRLLTENPEWSNILYAFDEKTDHILVDEFQDTNNFQWAIIDKLTEEWRSGMGAKREEGIMPTIFLVGDEKQSIYFFRGANVEIFQRAKKKLNNWLKDGFYYEEVKENYRSRPAIIDFTNHVFSRIMSTAGNVPSWTTRYNPFKACRADTGDTGRIEVILLDNDEAATAEVKQREADVIAKRIQSLVGSFRIKDRLSPLSSEQAVAPEPASGRFCKYMDMAVLLRRRTHLKKYEGAFRRHGIPFVIVKGIGFYQEPETAILRALVYFLSNPKDDYSLYIFLKSPFFLVDEEVIIMAAKCVGIDSRGHAVSTCRENDSLFSKLKAGGYAKKAVMLLEEWLAQIPYTPVSELIEKALVQTGAWTYFHESQRRANVKKFIRLVEDLEANGKSLLKIRNFLEQTYSKAEEPKANVNTEGMDAVRIMTVHASKGLEFPMVFVPGLEEPFMLKTDDSLIYERDGRLFFKYEPESAIRKQDEDFLLHLGKEEEEQKRLFYVAVTRAEESLFLVGQWNEKDNKSFLSFLKQGLGLERQGTGYKTDADIKGVSLLTEHDVDALYEKTPGAGTPKAPPAPAEVVPIEIKKAPLWKTVSEVVNIKRQHGKDWVILGDVIHRLFESISGRVITEHDIKPMAEKFLASKGILREEKERLLSIIKKDISLLKGKDIWQNVIMPRENSFSELPFILDLEETVYRGRIDRVIKDNGVYRIYDYKTFPVQEKEIEYLVKSYSSQLDIYRDAVKALFNAKKVECFIVFTHIGVIREVV